MKKIFWISFIFCLGLSSINIAYIYSNKLSQPYLFENVYFTTHLDYTYEQISIPFLTNRFDTNHIQYITIDGNYLYPINNSFTFNQKKPQLYDEYSLYNLNFSTFDLDETFINYIKSTDKAIYDIDLYFSNGYQAKQKLTVTILNHDRNILDNSNSTAYSSGLRIATWRAREDIVITNIYELNVPYKGKIKTQHDELDPTQLPWEIIKNELIYFEYESTLPVVPQHRNGINYLIIEGYKKNTEEPFVTNVFFQSSENYENDYFIHYLKDKELK